MLLKRKNQKSRHRETKRPFRLSLRFKLAFPVLILVSLMLALFFRATFTTVRELVLERTERRLVAIAEVFAETIKVPLILNNQKVLLANIEWMAKRPDVIEVRVEDASGVIVGGDKPSSVDLTQEGVAKSFLGVKRVNAGTYMVAVPIQAHSRKLGRVQFLFSEQGLEEELREIFEERLMFAFIAGIILSLLISAIAWVVIRPLFALKRTAQEILAGDLTARARISSFDEIADLGDAFNEMVARLTKSLDSLRSRTDALGESEEKYRLVIENAGDIIFTMSPDGEFSLLNKGFSGRKREDFLSEGLALFLSLLDDVSKNKFHEARQTLLNEKESVVNLALTQIHSRSKSEVFYLVNLTPVLDAENRVKHIQGVMRDVTEMRRIEVMKDALIRDVAHELKTPTAKFEMAVNWFEADLLKKGELEKYAKVIDILKTNTERLTTTIVSILDLTKLESGIHKLEAEDLNLNDVLLQVFRDMQSICQKKNIELRQDLCKQPLPMQGDRDMLYRLFVNLIGNSVKFTDIGHITLKSEIVDDQALVTVSDTGMGIEKEELENIFERFVQKTASSLGIGVGLTISKDIADLHQGRIWAESAGLGKGASFRVEFPLET